MTHTRLTAVLAAALMLSAAAPSYARHGELGPMAPRPVHESAARAEYSYGLTLLPGRTLDALEQLNRVVGWNFEYEFFDRYLLRPVAHAYSHLPGPVRTGVGNFLANLDDGIAVPMHLLALEPAEMGENLARFVVNSTAGLLGLFDVAGYLGIPRHPLSGGTLLGRYGVDQGAYLMVPVMGPATERSLHGSALDGWPYWMLPPYVGAITWTIGGIHRRAELIDQEELIDHSIDPYAQLRQIYLSYQEGQVHPEAALQTEEDSVDPAFLEEIDAR